MRAAVRVRVDDVVAALLAAAGLGTVAVTLAIAFPTWGEASLELRHPLNLEQWQALLTGLLSADLMVLSALLLARLPWLERAWGRGPIMAWHRRLAVWSFWLLVVHVLLFVLQRADRSPGRVWAALKALFLTDRHMLLATIGTALVLLVVVTSVAGARRWLRYETWHLTHLWSYLGLGLAVPHELASADFSRPWVRAWWWTLYVVAVALVLAFRVLLPLWRSARHGLRVSEIRPEAGGALSVVMTGRRLDALGARSGQFLVWRVLGRRGWTRGHPWSLSAAPTPTVLRVTVTTAGDAGARLLRVPVGSRVLIEGPYGAVPADRRRHERLLVIAAGVGVTPYRALLEDLDLAPGEVTLVHRVHNATGAVLHDELAALADRRGIELVTLGGSRRAAYSWLPEGVEAGEGEFLRDLVPDVAERDVWLCGPPEWTDSVQRALASVGVRRRDVRQEHFAW